jgi:hypothetical protein
MLFSLFRDEGLLVHSCCLAWGVAMMRCSPASSKANLQAHTGEKDPTLYLHLFLTYGHPYLKLVRSRLQQEIVEACD